jgi:hypothetical protein
VVAAAPQGEADPGLIQELLGAAQGYAVFGREGKRVGAFIELAGTGSEEIAIRHDGIFLWHRRVLPITTVASVFPKQRAIVLNVDRRSLASSQENADVLVETPRPVEESADSPEDVQRRIARYLSSGEREAEEANVDHADATPKPSAESAAPERPPLSPTPQPPSEHIDGTEHSVSRHLMFVSTSHGYTLLELEGPPPPLGADTEVPDEPGSFLVAKLGPSPLPKDPRICAYLERTDEDPALAETPERF